MSERNGCMKRYVALLRGINISGKNKIAMSELKAGFAELGYTAVSIYLNSGLSLIHICSTNLHLRTDHSQ